MKTRLSTALLLISMTALLLAGAGGCSEPPSDMKPGRSPKAYTTSDDWFHPPPADFRMVPKGTIVGSEDFAVVRFDLQAKAQATLADREFKPIDDGEAAELTGRRFALARGFKLFLLRGVYLDEASGAFAISYQGRSVVVDHTCKGSNPLPMNKKAVVAALPMTPDKVYVTCGMTE